jgi:Polyketide cyclase / dehydrase and lipid transport
MRFLIMSKANQIVWPIKYEPSICPVHVRNEIAIASSPEVVWAWLIRAQLWPTWYPNSANIVFLSGQPPDLAFGARFRWKTFGVTIESTVLEFVPFERLAWDGHGTGLDAYHAWLIQKTDSGCKVITEETQGGGVARLGKALRPHRMEQQHQVWLEGLRDKASSGLPPAP